MTDKTGLPYCISFDTKDTPNLIKAVRVELSIHWLRNMDDPVRVDLVDHPLYPALEQYVLANRGNRK